MSIKNGYFVKTIATLISLFIFVGLLPLNKAHAEAGEVYVKDFSYSINKDEGDPNIGDFHLNKSDSTHNPHWIGDSGFTNDDDANLEKLKALDGVVLFSDTAKAYDFGIKVANDNWAGAIATNIKSIDTSFVLSDGTTKPVKIDFKNTTNWKMYLEIVDKNNKFATFKIDEVKIPTSPNPFTLNKLTLVGGSVTDQMTIGILDSSRSGEPNLKNAVTINEKNYPAGYVGVSVGKGNEWNDSYLENLNQYTTYFVKNVNVEGVGTQTVILKLDVVIDINCAGCLTYNVSDCILANTYRIDIKDSSVNYDASTDPSTVKCNITGDFSDSKVITLDSNGAGTASTMLNLDPTKDSYSLTLKETPIEGVNTTPSNGYTINLESKNIIQGVSDYKLWTATVNGAKYDSHMTAEFVNTYGLPDLTDADVSASNSPTYNGEQIDLNDFGISVALDGTDIPTNTLKYHFYTDVDCKNEVLDISNNPCTPTDAGVYYVTFTGENYAGESSPIVVTIKKQSLMKPEVNSDKFVYDGTEKELDINLNGADSALFNIVGNTATDIGSYSACVTLADDKNYCWAGDDASSTSPSEPIMIDWTIEEPSKPNYEIIYGNDAEISIANDSEGLFTSNAPFAKFKEVRVDGKLVDPKYYTVEEGSTKVYLSAEFLKSLTLGKHTITIVSTDGQASTNFTVYDVEDEILADTDGYSNSALLSLIMIGSLTASSAIYIRRKKV